MLQKIALYAAVMIAIPVVAIEQREVANEVQPLPVQLSVANDDMRSFFEPKTESDVNALATLEQDLMSSLTEDFAN